MRRCSRSRRERGDTGICGPQGVSAGQEGGGLFIAGRAREEELGLGRNQALAGRRHTAHEEIQGE